MTHRLSFSPLRMALSLALVVGALSGCSANISLGRPSAPEPGSLVGINDRNAPKTTTTAPNTVAGDTEYWGAGLGGNVVVAPDTLSRSQILSGNVNSWLRSSEQEGRLREVEAAASALGAQAGLADRTRQIRAALLGNAGSYDRAFNFSRLMLEPGFLPPVITEARNAYNQVGDDEARASDRLFRIERGARIVSATPTWRTYLLADPTSAAAPSASVLPKGSAEKAAWDQAAAQGWEEGAHQADAAFEANLARLRQDFQGMLRFKMLYEQGLVTKPQLTRTVLGTTGGGDEMAVGDRIIRISERAMLDANRKNWSVGNGLPATDTEDGAK